MSSPAYRGLVSPESSVVSGSRVTIEANPEGLWFVVLDGKRVGPAIPRKAALCVERWLNANLSSVLSFPRNVTGKAKPPLTAPYRLPDPSPDKHGAAMAQQILDELTGRKTA